MPFGYLSVVLKRRSKIWLSACDYLSKVVVFFTFDM